VLVFHNIAHFLLLYFLTGIVECVIVLALYLLYYNILHQHLLHQ